VAAWIVCFGWGLSTGPTHRTACLRPPFTSGRMTILAGIEGQETGTIVPVFVASVGNGPSAGHECAKVSANIAIGQFSKRTGEVSSRRGDRVNA